jgi:hypothetical protein
VIFSRVGLLVPYSAAGVYLPTCSFRLPTGLTAEKVSILSKDFDAIFQVREGEGDFPTEYPTTEQAADRGFTSVPFVTAITGIRLRCNVPGQTTRINFTLYG